MFKKLLLLSALMGALISPIQAQTQTYSPYSAEQLREFNSQPIAPIQGTLGPVYPEMIEAPRTSNQGFDSRYIHNPDGEEQAQSQGAESAAPFEPIPATITF
jgi:hypothetical protein